MEDAYSDALSGQSGSRFVSDLFFEEGETVRCPTTGSSEGTWGLVATLKHSGSRGKRVILAKRLSSFSICKGVLNGEAGRLCEESPLGMGKKSGEDDSRVRASEGRKEGICEIRQAFEGDALVFRYRCVWSEEVGEVD